MKSPASKRIVLASNSPRRRQLLKEIVDDFDIAESREIEETYPENLPAEKVPAYLSRLKAEAFSDLIGSDNILMTADTVVILNGKILGKPHNEEEAVRMLLSLSGREHIVITGVTLKSSEKTDTFSCRTSVHFDEISEDEIRQYVAEFKPFDKAGSYGIQEWIGCRGISAINGCFYNVMGLPVSMIYNHLQSF